MLRLRGTDKSRLVQLDILRGVAILLVIGRHPVILPSDAGVVKPLANLWLRFGWTGVDLFFVLSGFLVGGLLLKELRTRSELDVGRFIVRRGFKIWPSYFVYLGFVLLELLYKYRHGHAWLWYSLRAIAPNLLHVQNYLGTPREHTWSLAVEEHFYLMLPLLLLMLVRRRQSRVTAIPEVPIIAIALIIICTGLRCLTPAGRSFSFYHHMYPTHLRIDSLFFGVLLAYLYHFKSERLAAVGAHRATLLITGIALVSPMMVASVRSRFVWTFGFTFLYLGYACILLAMLYAPLGVGWLGRFCGSRLARILAFVGYFSYPVYLWHIDAARLPLEFLVHRGVLNGLPPALRWVAATGAFTVAAVAAGVVLGLLVERPALALRDRLFPARASALIEAASEKQVDLGGARGIASERPERDDSVQVSPVLIKPEPGPEL
jgi:peptidoglycan/LPS O-acetylase OafA/YrhL